MDGRAAGLCMREETGLSKTHDMGMPEPRQSGHWPGRAAPDSLPFAQSGAVIDVPGRRPTAPSGWPGVRHATDRRIARLRRSLPLMLAEEAAYGHAFLFVPVATGAGAVAWFAARQDYAVGPLLVAFVVFALAAVRTRHGTGPFRLVACGLALFLGGMLLADLETRRLHTTILDTPVTTDVTGIVERREADGKGRWRYIVRLQETARPQLRRPPERVSLLSRSRGEPAMIGDAIGGRARLSPPSGPALPGLNDFAFSSYFDGVGAVGFFYGAPRLTAAAGVPKEGAGGISAWLFDLRSQIGARIRATVSGDPGAFAAAIVTDERRAISQDTTEALRLAGLAHIVAISGLNMALAAGIFFVGVRTVLSLAPAFAQSWPIKKIAAFGALVMVTAYYLISGFGVSAERAYIMMAVILVAVLFDRQSLSLRNVALSALIIIAVSPSEILGPSFQMSFAATAALIAGYEAWQRRRLVSDRVVSRKRRHRLVTSIAGGSHFLAGIVMTSLIGSVSTTMFSVEHFHRIATYGLAANLAAMPLISFVVMPAGLIAMLLMPFGLDAPFLKVMGLGLEGVIAIARYVAAWGGDVGIGRQHVAFLAVATIGFVLLVLLRTRLRLLGLPFLMAAVSLSWQQTLQPRPDLLVSEDGTIVDLIADHGISTNRARVPDFVYDQWRRALTLPDPEPPLVTAAGSARPTAGQPKRDPAMKGKTSLLLADELDEENERPGSPQEDSTSRQTGASGTDPPASARSHGKDTSPVKLTRDERLEARKAIAGAPVDRFLCNGASWCAAKARAGPLVVVVEDSRYAGVACDVATIVIAAKASFDECLSGALLLTGDSLRKTGALEFMFAGSSRTAGWTVRAAMAGRDRPWTQHRLYDWRSRSFDRTLPEPLSVLINGSGGSVLPASPGP